METKINRWTIKYNSDSIFRTRSIIKPQTRLQWNRLYRVIRRIIKSESYRCNCEYDCCGCISHSSGSIEYTPTHIIVHQEVSLNY